MEDDVLSIVKVDPSVPVVGLTPLFVLLLEPRGGALVVRNVSRFSGSFEEPRAPSHFRRCSAPINGRPLTS